MLIRLALLAAGASSAACTSGAAPPAAWHAEAGYRWRELAGAGARPDGFTRLAPSSTGISFTNSVSDSAATRNRHLMDGAGVAIGDVDGDGRPDIYFARTEGPNALYLNQGGMRFRDVAAERGVALGDRPSTGVAFADVDGDGDLDLIVASMGGRNSLFLNDGHGRFTNQTESSGFVPESRGSTTVTLADVDGDGDLDLYVANYKARTMLDSLSPEQRSFEQLTRKVGNGYEVIPERRADYKLRERPDLRGMSLVQRADPDWFYLNDGTGHFTREPVAGNPRFLDEDGKPLAEEPEDFGLAARFYDVNGDGAPDLYVANDFEDPDRFWINDGSGHFRLIARQALRQTSNSDMAVDFADIDRDGTVDMFEVDMLASDTRRRKTQTPTHTALQKKIGVYTERAQWQRNTLLRNRGDGTFAEIADVAGVAASGWSWSTMFLDVDLDGYEDLLIGNGHTWDLMDADTQERLAKLPNADWRQERQFYPRLALANVAFRNRGDRTFEDAGAKWHWGDEEDISHGMAAGDLDGDGDLDVVINRLGSPASVMRNDATEPRVTVRLVGRGKNTAGIGARIRVQGGPVHEQTREVTAGGLYLSSSDQEYAFAARADSAMTIEVRWRSGGFTAIPDARAGRLYEIREPESGAVPPPATPEAPPLFTDVSALLGAVHHESFFNDYLRQPLLGFQLSQLGPGVSWMDLDQDGDDDLVVAGGPEGELAWYRNDRTRFTRVPIPVKPEWAFTMSLRLPTPQGVSLLVGQASYRARSPAEAFVIPDVTRLDLGPGGKLLRTEPMVSPDTMSTGPLALADLDGDGDLDLFVGGRVLPGAYPVPPHSHVYLNTNGKFTLDTRNDPVFRQIGLISAAVFSDLDGDGDPDLALATEWGPVRILINDHGQLTEATGAWGMAQEQGGWKGLTAADFDGDGRMDLVATNWGKNVPFPADSARPLYMYVGNFGPSSEVSLLFGKFDPRINAIAPVASMPRLSVAMPDLRSRITSFAEYADAGIDKVIGPAFQRAIRIQLTTVSHTLFLNRGGRFEIRPLPEEAQEAPAFAAVAADFDGDGDQDLFLGQNFSQTEVGTPAFDAGRGLLLLNDGQAHFSPMPGQRSGIVIYGDQRGAAASDYDGDGRIDLAVSQNGAAYRLLHNTGADPGLRVRLVGPAANPGAIGAVLRAKYADGEGPAQEVHGGSNYWSEDGLVPVVSLRKSPMAITVRWPGGGITQTLVESDAREVRISSPHK